MRQLLLSVFPGIVANGVPLMMGRALARAIKECLEECCESRP